MTTTFGVGRRAPSLESASAGLRRWLKFSLVGGLGILVQLSTLAALTKAAGLHYLPATGLAVEVAVLHNFLWHEHWTWSDRAAQNKRGKWKRLLRFHMANGALSIGGNMSLMQLLVGVLNINQTLANILSINLCSVLNFLASDRMVFENECGLGAPKFKALRIFSLPESVAKLLAQRLY